MPEGTNDPYELLAVAIIKQATEDYKDSYRKLLKLKREKLNKAISKKTIPQVRAVIKEIESFFCSDWFEVLTNLDGGILLTRIKEMVREELIKS